MKGMPTREPNRSKFPVPADVSRFAKPKFAVPVKSGMCVQHAGIAALIDARKRPNDPKMREFPAIFPVVREIGRAPVPNVPPPCSGPTKA
jgi:hypothetical protein